MQKQDVTGLPESCFDCQNIDCRLPYSKVIPTRKRADYAYKRHPNCKLEHPEISEMKDLKKKKLG